MAKFTTMLTCVNCSDSRSLVSLRCLGAGMNAHVGKPFKLGELVELLQKLTSPGSGLKTPTAMTVTLRNPNPNPIPEPALPHIDAVDMTGALERLGGNTALYARVLQSYLMDIAGQPEQLELALNSVCRNSAPGAVDLADEVDHLGWKSDQDFGHGECFSIDAREEGGEVHIKYPY